MLNAALLSIRSHTVSGPHVRHVLCAFLFLAMSLTANTAAAENSPTPSTSPSAMAANPLLTESTLPYHIPPFDKIKDEQFVPAMEQGMAEELKQVDVIAANPEKPTFENTIVALERGGQLLARADRIFSNLNSAHTNPALQKIDTEMAPKLSAHRDAIHLNGPLFARVQAIYDSRDKAGLDPESKYLVERYYKDFVRAGARLSDSDKVKLKAMNAARSPLREPEAARSPLRRRATITITGQRSPSRST